MVYKLSYKNVSNQCIKLNHNMIEYPPEGSSKFYVSKTVNEDKVFECYLCFILLYKNKKLKLLFFLQLLSKKIYCKFVQTNIE